MKKSKKLIFIVILAFSLLFSGCADSYEHLIGEHAAEQTVDQISNMQFTGHLNFRTWLMNLTLKIADAFKVPAIIFAPLSIVIGIVMLNVFKNTASVKKTAWFVFIIGIPLILILLGWGSAILYTILYQQ